MYVYICVYVYMYICIHMYVCIYIYVCVRVCVCLRVCLCVGELTRPMCILQAQAPPFVSRPYMLNTWSEEHNTILYSCVAYLVIHEP